MPVVTEFVIYEDGVRVLKSISDTQDVLNVEDGATAAGATGDAHAAATGNPHDTSIFDLADVNVSVPADGQVLKFDTGAVVNGALGFGDLGGVPADNSALSTALDGKLGVDDPIAIGDITGLQTALDGKETAGAATTAVSGHVAAGDPHTQYLTNARGDARYPSITHATRHQSGGADPIKLDDLAAPDDNTDLNSTVSAHGLAPKLSGNATQFLNGIGTWTVPPSAGGITSVFSAENYGLSPSGSAASNNAALDSMFAAGRQVARPVYVFGPGPYTVSESISPSGKASGVGSNPGRITCVFNGTHFTAAAGGTYMDIRRGSGAGVLLTSCAPDGQNIIPNDGMIFTGGAGVAKKVFWNARGCGNSRYEGNLKLQGNNQVNLVAISSSGGMDGDYTTESWCLRNSHFHNIQIEAFEIGFHLMHYDQAQVDPGTNLSIDYYDFNGGTAWVNDSNTDGVHISKAIWSQAVQGTAGQSYQSGGRTMTIDNFFPVMRLQYLNQSHFSVGGKGTLNLGSVYTHQATVGIGFTGPFVNVCDGGTLKVGIWHNDTNNGFIIPGTATSGVAGTPGGAIYVGRNNQTTSGTPSTTAGSDQSVMVGGFTRQSLGDSGTGAAYRQFIALDRSASGPNMQNKSRQITVGSFNDTVAAGWVPVKQVKTTAGWASADSSGKDKVTVDFSEAGWQQMRPDGSGGWTVL